MLRVYASKLKLQGICSIYDICDTVQLLRKRKIISETYMYIKWSHVYNPDQKVFTDCIFIKIHTLII